MHQGLCYAASPVEAFHKEHQLGLCCHNFMRRVSFLFKCFVTRLLTLIDHNCAPLARVWTCLKQHVISAWRTVSFSSDYWNSSD
jgi:hypothetical protein